MSTATLTKETITVGAIGKFGVKVGDVWYGTAKDTLKPTDFVAGQTYEVLTEPWAKGGKSGKNITQIIGQGAASAAPAVSNTAPRGTTAAPAANKDQRILWQGVTQAALQSPAIAGMQFTNVNEYVSLVKEAATQLVAFIEDKAR